ncbi:hypothetical protein [uncultured Methylobacterium sp.]|uniref:hypothetical protein n=1 Tax=uncultured Methylobacterium sp. TaxID=157278 RepID=UPI0035CA74FA
METVLILAAVTACAAAGLVALALTARGRRAPLRMDSDLDEVDERMVLASVAPPASPIDRSAAVSDLDPVDAGRDHPEDLKRLERFDPAEGGTR